MNAYYPPNPFGGHHAESFRPMSHYSVNHYGGGSSSHLGSISSNLAMCGGGGSDDAVGYGGGYDSMQTADGLKGFQLHHNLRTGGSIVGGDEMDYHPLLRQHAPAGPGAGSPPGAPCLDSPAGAMHRTMHGQQNVGLTGLR